MEILFYLLAAMPYAIAALLGLALPLLLLAAYNRFVFGLGLICITFVLETMNMSEPFLRIGVTWFIPDLPMVLIGSAAGLRWLLRNDVPKWHPAWVLLALLFFANLAFGLAKNGTAAGVAARPDYYAVAAASYAMSFPIGRRQIQQLVHSLTAVAAALILICCYRWVVYYAQISELLPPGGVYNIDGAIRVIGSPSALILAEASILGLFFGRAAVGAESAKLLSPLLLSCVLVLQHRSVWLAGIAGVLLCMLFTRAQRAPLWQQFALVFAIGLTAAAPLAFNATISEQVQSSASRGLAGEGTVAARFSNWRATIDKWAAEGPRAIALGSVMGSDPVRTIETETGELRRIEFGAHNHFVGVLTSLGVVGFAATLWVFVYTATGLWRLAQRGDAESPLSAVLLVLIGMQLVYYIAYPAHYLQYLVLGVAIAWIAVRDPSVVASAARRRPGPLDREASAI